MNYNSQWYFYMFLWFPLSFKIFRLHVGEQYYQKLFFTFVHQVRLIKNLIQYFLMDSILPLNLLKFMILNLKHFIFVLILPFSYLFSFTVTIILFIVLYLVVVFVLLLLILNLLWDSLFILIFRFFTIIDQCFHQFIFVLQFKF